jgi:hypothetical protein
MPLALLTFFCSLIGCTGHLEPRMERATGAAHAACYSASSGRAQVRADTDTAAGTPNDNILGRSAYRFCHFQVCESDDTC